MLPQGALGHFDRDLVDAHPRQLHLGNTGCGAQVVADPFGDDLQRLLGHVPVHDHVDHLVAPHRLHDHRFLGFGGEGLDAVDGCLYVVEDAAGILPLLQLRGNDSDPLRGRRPDAADAGKAGEPLLYAAADPVLHLFRTGPEVGNLDLDLVERELGEGLLAHPGDAEKSRQEEKAHQQVGRDVVAGHPGDRGPHRDTSPATRMRMPSVTPCSAETTTTSPGSRSA